MLLIFLPPVSAANKVYDTNKDGQDERSGKYRSDDDK
jgi:hypothetical protein